MSYGIIEYNEEGQPKCEICGKYFKRVLTHVRQKHTMTEREYKKQFGFDTKKGICSKESSELSREKVLDNYDKCITQNLNIGGQKNRYEKGSKGRTKDKVSQQTRLRLRQRLQEDPMMTILKALGMGLGLSGAGNKARWNKNNDK